MQVKFSNQIDKTLDSLVIAMSDELSLTHYIKEVDSKLDGKIRDAILSENFKGKKDEVFHFYNDSQDLPKIIILMGLENKEDLDHNKIMYLGGKIIASLNILKLKSANMILPDFDSKSENSASLAALGAILRNYRFNKYRTKDKELYESTVKSITVLSDDSENSQVAFDKLTALSEGIYLTRNLVSEPPNILYPESYADEVSNLKEIGIDVEILDENQMQKLGMGALLGVAQGSKRPARIAIMKYKNNKNNDNYQLALVGKGVTFDTGGISLKPAPGMEDMKYDMAGSAVVVGVMKSLALRKADVNVVGLIGLVENMPDGYAQRPSDVVISMSGQTIEVLNTDAEGRLVLADVLWYTQDRFKPEYMIDLATLTGAITVTFGSIYGGLFSNDDMLADMLYKAGIKSDEKLWRLPMGEVYNKMINSEIADMQNISNEKGAGSITAAQFLERFVGNTKWAHLDIAGMAWTKKETNITPKGATAFGVRLLDRFIKDNIEQ